jgi:hypothetical protein
MKKISIKRKKKEILSSGLKIDSPIGFIDVFGRKGYFVYVGLRENDFDVFHAICANEYKNAPNTSYGGFDENKFTEFPEYGELAVNEIKEAFVFETQKELYRWLSED